MLLQDLRKTKGYERGLGWNDAEQRKAELKAAGETLQSVILLFRHWAMFVKQGSEPGILTAKPNLPRLVSPVLLNATANQDVLLDHIGATIVPMPTVRNYGNLTIRILRSNGIGKTTMAELGKARLERLCKFIRQASEPEDSWLVVTHKVNEPLACKYLPPDLALTAHWGALDGLNDFKECNKAVLFGISYRDPTWSSALYFALRGVEGSDWFKTAEARAIKHTLEAKLMASQVLQAIGRPRSRRVIDESGNCLPTTIYLTLPESSLGRTVEKYIRQTLQGVVIEPWDYTLDGEDVDSFSGKPNLTAAAVAYMRNSPPGKFTVNEIAHALGLDASQRASIKDALKKGRKLVQELTAIDVD